MRPIVFVKRLAHGESNFYLRHWLQQPKIYKINKKKIFGARITRSYFSQSTISCCYLLLLNTIHDVCIHIIIYHSSAISTLKFRMKNIIKTLTAYSFYEWYQWWSMFVRFSSLIIALFLLRLSLHRLELYLLWLVIYFMLNSSWPLR